MSWSFTGQYYNLYLWPDGQYTSWQNVHMVARKSSDGARSIETLHLTASLLTFLLHQKD